jgi:hypothetical protein
MICWHKPGPWREQCQKDHRGNGDIGFMYGRCRSGKRWFWYVSNYDWRTNNRITDRGWSDSEDQALGDARAAIVRLVGDRDGYAYINHGCASLELKEINTAKRRAKPPSDARGAPIVEYLYSSDKRYQIIKRTKERVYYLKEGESLDEHGEPLVSTRCPYIHSASDDEVGFITLTKLKHGSASGYRWLYPSFEPILAERRRHDEYWRQKRAEYLAKHGLPPDTPDDLAALKSAMAAAHPDRGGSSAAFIEARQRYVAARRVLMRTEQP